MLVRAPAAVRETPQTEVFWGWRGMTEDGAGAGGAVSPGDARFPWRTAIVLAPFPSPYLSPLIRITLLSRVAIIIINILLLLLLSLYA